MNLNLKLLNDKIKEINIPLSTLSEKMGISRQTLYLKLTGKRRLKMSEANNLSEILRLTNSERTSIFFDSEVDTFTNLN